MKILFEIKGENLCAIKNEENSKDKAQELLKTLAVIEYFDEKFDSIS